MNLVRSTLVLAALAAAALVLLLSLLGLTPGSLTRGLAVGVNRWLGWAAWLTPIVPGLIAGALVRRRVSGPAPIAWRWVIASELSLAGVLGAEAEAMMRNGYVMREEPGRGFRRVVASPRPLDVVEKESVRALVRAGQLVITVGGGGIPVIRQGHHLKGASPVIDKDLASAKLAEQIDADLLIILTTVEKVALHFGTPKQRSLDRLSVDEARRYIAQGHFAKGSMLPKVEAAVEFAASKPGRSTLITLLGKAREGIEGRTGTRIGPLYPVGRFDSVV